MKKVTIITLVVSLMTIFGAAVISYAGPPVPTQPLPGPLIEKEKLQERIPIPLPDLVVTHIKGGNCPDCRCGRTNFGNHPLVEYMEDINVYVKNQGKATSDPCTLKITLYDVVGGRTAVITKAVPALAPDGLELITEGGEFLFRKRTGITATVDATNVVPESNEANNSMTVHECIVPPLI